MENFTREQVKQMRIEITQAINEVVSKYGSVSKLGSISFGSQISTKLVISRVSSNEHGKYVNSREAQAFLSRAESLGLTQNVLNEGCRYKGKVYTVTGYNTRAPKYPINMTVDGKPMKCSVQYMKDFVRAERPELFL